MTGHTSSTIKVNIAPPGKEATWRHRGRCSCGWGTYQHYSTPAAARTAVDHVHIQPLKDIERTHA